MLSSVSYVCLGACAGMWVISRGIYLGVLVLSFISVLLFQRSGHFYLLLTFQGVCVFFLLLRPRNTMRQIAAIRRRDRLLQQIASCDMWKSLSLRQNLSLRSVARITGSPHIRLRMNERSNYLYRACFVAAFVSFLRARGKLRGLLAGGLEPRSRKSGTRKFLGGSDRSPKIIK